MRNEFFIDWENLPTCGDQGLIVSPYICIDGTPPPPPVEPPPTAVPEPGILGLFAMGAIMMVIQRRRK